MTSPHTHKHLYRMLACALMAGPLSPLAMANGPEAKDPSYKYGFWESGNSDLESSNRLDYTPRVTSRPRHYTSTFFKSILTPNSLINKPFKSEVRPTSFEINQQAQNQLNASDIEFPSKRLVPALNALETAALWPQLKSHVKKNSKYWRKLSPTRLLVYADDTYGYTIAQNFTTTSMGSFSINFYDTVKLMQYIEPVFRYYKTPAINPQTKQAWITIEPDYIAGAMKECNQKLSAEEIAYLKNVLFILNENFHYFYGESFIDFSYLEDMSENFFCRYLPFKTLIFDQFEALGNSDTDQRQELSYYLGRAAYDFDKVWDKSTMPELKNEESSITNKNNKYRCSRILSGIKLIDGQNLKTMRLITPAAPAGLGEGSLRPSYAQRWAQVYHNALFIHQMSLGLSQLLDDMGVDPHQDEKNTTVMAKLMYYINLKAQNYFNAFCSTDYLRHSTMASDKQRGTSFEGYAGMYEVVALPERQDFKPIADLFYVNAAKPAAWIGHSIGKTAQGLASIPKISPSLPVDEPVAEPEDKPEDKPVAEPVDEPVDEPIAEAAAAPIKVVESHLSAIEQEAANTQLRQACRDGDMSLIEELLNKGADVNTKKEEEGTPLHIAVDTNNQALVDLVLQYGANINATKMDRGRGASPAMQAAFNDQSAMCIYLLNKGADPNFAVKGSRSLSLLGRVTLQNLTEVIPVLYAKGADPTLPAYPESKDTVLHICAAKKLTDMAILHMQNGADIYQKNANNQTAIDQLKDEARARYIEMHEKYYKPAKQASPQPVESTGAEAAFLEACKKGDLLAVVDYIHQKVNINALDASGNSALHIACASKNQELVELLLENQADINQQTRDEKAPCPPLLTAAQHQAKDIFFYLLEKGAETNVKLGKDSSLLLEIAYTGQLELLSALLKAGAEVNLILGDKNLICLHYLSDIKYSEAAKILIANGANIYQPNAEGQNFLQLCEPSQVATFTSIYNTRTH